MLTIIVPEAEYFNEETQEFVYTKKQTLKLEHSLVSLSKWESKWKKPFLGREKKTFEEIIDYIRCMTITQNVDPSIYLNLDADSIKKINAYIDDKMTATTFPEDVKRGGMREQVTSELIYYWMVNFNIPFECEKWHLNRLLTLIQVCSVKANASGKKMKPQEVLKQNNELNALRRKQLGSKG